MYSDEAEEFSESDLGDEEPSDAESLNSDNDREDAEDEGNDSWVVDDDFIEYEDGHFSEEESPACNNQRRDTKKKNPKMPPSNNRKTTKRATSPAVDLTADENEIFMDLTNNKSQTKPTFNKSTTKEGAKKEELKKQFLQMSMIYEWHKIPNLRQVIASSLSNSSPLVLSTLPMNEDLRNNSIVVSDDDEQAPSASSNHNMSINNIESESYINQQTPPSNDNDSDNNNISSSPDNEDGDDYNDSPMIRIDESDNNNINSGIIDQDDSLNQLAEQVDEQLTLSPIPKDNHQDTPRKNSTIYSKRRSSIAFRKSFVNSRNSVGGQVVNVDFEFDDNDFDELMQAVDEVDKLVDMMEDIQVEESDSNNNNTSNTSDSEINHNQHHHDEESEEEEEEFAMKSTLELLESQMTDSADEQANVELPRGSNSSDQSINMNSSDNNNKRYQEEEIVISSDEDENEEFYSADEDILDHSFEHESIPADKKEQESGEQKKNNRVQFQEMVSEVEIENNDHYHEFNDDEEEESSNHVVDEEDDNNNDDSEDDVPDDYEKQFILSQLEQILPSEEKETTEEAEEISSEEEEEDNNNHSEEDDQHSIYYDQTDDEPVFQDLTIESEDEEEDVPMKTPTKGLRRLRKTQIVDDSEEEEDTQGPKKHKLSKTPVKSVPTDLHKKKIHSLTDDKENSSNLSNSKQISRKGAKPQLDDTDILGTILRSTTPVYSGKQFVQRREELAYQLYALYNRKVFSDVLPKDLRITWKKSLNTTAGRAIRRRNGSVYESEIELATKVVDDTNKLRNTLCHELCHVAAWLINHCENPPHGDVFYSWARKAEAHFPMLSIRTCHNYQINFKYQYRCQKCGYTIGRHSKSLDTTKKVCGKCYGTFQLVPKLNKNGAPRKAKSTSFTEYVKNNCQSLMQQNPGLTLPAATKLLATKWKAMKSSLPESMVIEIDE